MITILSEPNTVAHSAVALTDFTWTPFHSRKLIYQDPEGSSTPGKPVLQLGQVNVLAIYTESNHEYWLSDPTAVVHSTDWLDLNIFPPAEDALSRTRRFINTRKTDFAMKASECSGDLYSATGRPIHFMLCSRVGFSGTADLMALFSIRTNSRWRPPPSWIIWNDHISATAHDLLI